MSPILVSELYGIFDSNGWMGRPNHREVFGRFCILLDNLREEEQQLIVELTKRYTWIPLTEYDPRIRQVFASVDDVDKSKNIIIFPVFDINNSPATKSGHVLWHTSKALMPSISNEHYKNKSLSFIEDFNLLQKKINTVNDEVFSLFLIDDYVGSGNTITNTLESLSQKIDVSSIKICILTIAIQEIAKKKLEENGYKVYSTHICKRGITDYYQSSELEKKVQLMVQIEKILISKKFSFGYERTEALLTLLRPPNNTFPIFWQDHKKGDTKYTAPFPRY